MGCELSRSIAVERRTTASRPSERRRHPRFSAFQTFADSVHGSADVVNVSRRGMLLESLIGLPVGNSLSFQVSRRGHREDLKVDGRIQWCRLVTTQVAAGGDVVPRYQSGVAFGESNDPVAREIWTGLQIIGDRDEPADEAANDAEAKADLEPPLILIHRPQDGARVHSDRLRITGWLLDPLLGLPVMVNGCAARIEDHRFEVEVTLDEGLNTLTAAAMAGDEFVYRSPAVTIEYEPRKSATLLADAARRRRETLKLFN